MYIYKITNNFNGKIYIGLSTKNINESEDYYGSGALILKAIDKYGKENFTKEILEYNIADLAILQKREIYWIDYYNACVKDIGYNITIGGTGGDTLSNHPNIKEISSKISKSVKRVWSNPEYKAGQSAKRKKEWTDPEYKKKMSSLRKGHPAYPNQIKAVKETWTGKKHKPESIEKNRIAHLGKRYSDEVNKSKGRPGSKWYHNPETGETTMSTTKLLHPWVRGRGKLK